MSLLSDVTAGALQWQELSPNNRKPFADAMSGHKSTLWMQLGNIAQRVGHTINIDPSNGHIIADNEAMKFCTREYEKGWEPTL